MEKLRRDDYEIHPKLQTISSLISGLYQMLGKRYEVVLHDLRRADSSIIEIAGDLTERDIGGPITNYVLRILRKYGNHAPDRINYRTINKDGRILRSSTIFIRDDDGKIIGCLCFNQDVTDYQSCLKLLNDMCDFNDEYIENAIDEEEIFAHNIIETMEEIVYYVLEEYDKSVAAMKREDRFDIVMKLDERGIFAIKQAVGFVAKCLGVSPYTIYNYLKEIHSSNNI